MLLAGALYWSAEAPAVEKRDFSVTYLGSRMLLLGYGPNIYNLDSQHQVKSSLFTNSEPLIYEHPPFEALLLSPLAALPYRAAYLAWGMLNIAIWLALPLILRPYVPVPHEPLAYFALWLLFAPLGVALFQGQSSLLVLLAYSLAYIALRRGRDFRAGLILGLALVKFQFVLPFVLILALRKKWRFLQGFSLTAALFALLSLVAVGFRGILAYIHLLTSVASHPENLSYGAAVDMATIEAFFHALVGNFVAPSITALLVFATSAACILWIVSTWKAADLAADPRSFDLVFAAAIVVSLVAGFHMFTHDLSPLILAMLLACAHLADSTALSTRVLLLACMILFWIPPVFFLLLEWHRFYALFPVLMLFAFACARLSMNLDPPSSPVFLPAPPLHSIERARQA